MMDLRDTIKRVESRRGAISVEGDGGRVWQLGRMKQTIAEKSRDTGKGGAEAKTSCTFTAQKVSLRIHILAAEKQKTQEDEAPSSKVAIYDRTQSVSRFKPSDCVLRMSMPRPHTKSFRQGAKEQSQETLR